MIYIFEDMTNYTDELYFKHFNCVPEWRKRQTLSYKRIDDRKKSILTFCLLMLALRKEYGITEINEFDYNEYGKPFIKGEPVHFSLSHCANAVACAVSNSNIGIDVEYVSQYSHDTAQKVCNIKELAELEKTENPRKLFEQLWTKKEAISKLEGVGISMGFSAIDLKKYKVDGFYDQSELYSMSVCYGKSEENFMPLKVTRITLEQLLQIT